MHIWCCTCISNTSTVLIMDKQNNFKWWIWSLKSVLTARALRLPFTGTPKFSCPLIVSSNVMGHHHMYRFLLFQSTSSFSHNGEESWIILLLLLFVRPFLIEILFWIFLSKKRNLDFYLVKVEKNPDKKISWLEANHFYNFGVLLYFPTDSHA